MTDIRRPPVSLLRASCWLGLVFVATKAASLATTESALWPRALLMSTWSDVLFALVLGVLGQIAVTLVSKWSKAAAFVRGAFLGFDTLCALYAVLAVGLFAYFQRPLTYDFLGLVGNAAAVRSSVLARITPVLAVAAIGVPALFLAVAVRAGRGRGVPVLLLGIAGVWVASGWSLHRKHWQNEKSPHLWVSPHAELLRTTALRLKGGRRPAFPKEVPLQAMAEFRTFGARDSTRRTHFQLPPGAERPRNALVIILESVGTKYLGLYGYPLQTTPYLLAESRHALVFDQIYAHGSFSYASFRALNFSVYPGLPWHYALLEDGRPLPRTLAAALQARGARTAYLTSGDLDWGDQRWLLENRSGFDILEGAAELGCPLLNSWGAEDSCLVDRVIRWIDEEPGKPFFAVCWTDQTHDPYLLRPGTGPADFSPGTSRPALAADLSRYLTLLRETDAQIARLLTALRERGLADETLVVVTGDHGEAFADPHEQRGHAWSVYEEEVHVPLVLWNPRLFPGGGRAQTIGGHVDLNPTLADLLDVEPGREWQGYSLFDPERPARAFFMAIGGGDIFGVREGDWKYMHDVTSGRELLFDLALDPDELRDLAAREPERVWRLRQRVAAWVAFEDAFLWGRTN